MKKLKFIAMLLAALFVSATFVGCSDDDNEDNIALVGTWSSGDESDFVEYLAYYADGTGKAWSVEDGEEKDANSFTWTANGNKVTLTSSYMGETITQTVYWKVEGGKLLISNDNSFTEVEVWGKPSIPTTGGGDNNSDANVPAFVGTWSRGENGGYEEFVTFYADGTGKEWATYNGEIEERYTSAFTWKVVGNKITMTYEEDGETETEGIYWKMDGGNLVTAEDAEFKDFHTLRKPGTPTTGGDNNSGNGDENVGGGNGDNNGSSDENVGGNSEYKDLFGTWNGEGYEKSITYTFNADGTGKCVEKRTSDGRTDVCSISWSVTSEGKLSIYYKDWYERESFVWELQKTDKTHYLTLGYNRFYKTIY